MNLRSNKASNVTMHALLVGVFMLALILKHGLLLLTTMPLQDMEV